MCKNCMFLCTICFRIIYLWSRIYRLCIKRESHLFSTHFMSHKNNCTHIWLWNINAVTACLKWLLLFNKLFPRRNMHSCLPHMCNNLLSIIPRCLFLKTSEQRVDLRHIHTRVTFISLQWFIRALCNYMPSGKRDGGSLTVLK